MVFINASFLVAALLDSSTIKNANEEKRRCRELSYPRRVRIDIARSAPLSLLHCKGTGLHTSEAYIVFNFYRLDASLPKC